MGTLLGFVVGYVMGARAGPEGFDTLVASARNIATTPEVKGLISGGFGLMSDALLARAKQVAIGTGQAALRRAA